MIKNAPNSLDGLMSNGLQTSLLCQLYTRLQHVAIKISYSRSQTRGYFKTSTYLYLKSHLVLYCVHRNMFQHTQTRYFQTLNNTAEIQH